MWVFIIIILYLIGAVFATCANSEEDSSPNKMKWIYAAMIPGGILILAGVGFVWYWLCGGALVFEADNFGDKVLFFFLSLIPLIFIIGIIAIIFGWNPRD